MLKVLKFEKKFDSKFQWFNFCDGEVGLCTILFWWKSNQTSVSVETLMRYISVIERHAKKWKHQGFISLTVTEAQILRSKIVLYSTNMPSKQVLICLDHRLNLIAPLWSSIKIIFQEIVRKAAKARGWEKAQDWGGLPKITSEGQIPFWQYFWRLQ